MTQLPWMPLHEKEIAEAQSMLSTQMRALIENFAPHLYQVLKDDDKVFLEPLLFAYFRQDDKRIPLDQLLWGYLPEAFKKQETLVYADKEGCIELPNYGYLLTNQKNKQLMLRYQEDKAVLLSTNAGCVDFVFEPYIYLPGNGVTLHSHYNDLLKEFFVDDRNEVQTVDLVELNAGRIGQVQKAIEAIDRLLPQYGSVIKSTTRSIFLYSGELPYSFATLGAHGMVFLQTAKDADDLFFMEDLIHQCGHVLFSALNLVVKFLKVPEEFPLRALTLKEQENRSVFITLHGLFTEAWMSKFLAMHLFEEGNSSSHQMETLGRLAMIFTRFGIDLSTMYPFDLFSNQGRALMNGFMDLYKEIYERCGTDMQSVSISNQPYCFNKNLFFRANPKTEIFIG